MRGDMTERHYLKYVFRIFFKDNVTFKNDEETFFLLGCDMFSGQIVNF